MGDMKYTFGLGGNIIIYGTFETFDIFLTAQSLNLLQQGKIKMEFTFIQ